MERPHVLNGTPVSRTVVAECLPRSLLPNQAGEKRMRRTRLISSLIVALLAVVPIAIAHPQGKGQGKEKGEKAQVPKGTGYGAVKQDKSKPVQGRGKASDKIDRPDRGNQMAKTERPDKADKVDKPRGLEREFGGEVVPREFHVFAASPKKGQRLAGLAVARAAKRGMSGDDFIITPEPNRVRILNRSGALLLDLDDDRDVGIWRVVTEPDRNKNGAPSFCRSGAGHPVWGRQWCIDKGFGLGTDEDFRWARAIDFNNVVFQRPITTTELLTRDLLAGLLGDNAFNRLAAHAITLGLVEPLAGRWIGEPVGPRVLLVSSGPRPIAEMVDVDRDNRADLLVVATRP
jgi:hypothetical protein